MKVLITGVAGFIGSHLAKKFLQRNDYVYGIDSFTDYYPRYIKEANLSECIKDPNFYLLEGSINKMILKPTLNEIDYVFHLAAQAGVRSSWDRNFFSYTSNNINATQHLLEECKGTKIKKFIFASSSSVYGQSKKLPMKENHKLSPVSPYGLTKLVGEQLCSLYHKTYGIPIVCLRYFTAFGPKQRPDMAFYKFMLSLVEKKPIIIYGNGKQTRDFTYIDDIIDATVNAAFYGKLGEIYNIGGGCRNKLLDVVIILQEITGIKIEINYIEPQKGDVKDTYADIEKAKREIKYNPSVNLKEGLSEQWKWFLKAKEANLLYKFPN